MDKLKPDDPMIIKIQQLLGCEILAWEDGTGYFELKIYPNEFNRNPDIKKTISLIHNGLKCMVANNEY